jgi:hypothetical protein
VRLTGEGMMGGLWKNAVTGNDLNFASEDFYILSRIGRIYTDFRIRAYICNKTHSCFAIFAYFAVKSANDLLTF